MAKAWRFSAIFLPIAIICLTVAGCAFSPVERPVTNASPTLPSRQYNLPAADMFEVAMVAAKSNGFEISAADAQTGKIRTNLQEIPVEGNANCGTWNGVTVTGMVASVMLIEVKSSGDGGSVVTLDPRMGARFMGRNLYGMVTRDETYRCGSLGGLENRYFASLDTLAAHWQKNGVYRPVSPPPSKPQKTVNEDKLQKLEMMKALGLVSPQEYEAEKVRLTPKPTESNL